MGLIHVSSPRFWLSAGLLLASALSPEVGHAQTKVKPDQGHIELAKSHHQQGLSFFDEGQFEMALTEFENAYTLVPNYRLLLNIALTQEQLGDIRSAYRSLERFLADGSEKIPEAEAAEALAKLKELRDNLGSVSLKLSPGSHEIQLDGEAVDPHGLDRALLINPGRHELVLRSNGGFRETRSFSIKAGESKTLDLSNEKEAGAKASHPRIVAVGSTAPPVDKDAGRKSGKPMFPWWAWTATGALGAGAATAGILALDARGQEKALEEDGATGDERVEVRDRVQTTALVSDVLLGLSVLSLGASVYFTIEWNEKKSELKRSAQILPTPGGVLLRGTF